MRKRFFSVLILVAAQLAVVNAKVAVTTYHYDNLRTGWNRHDTALTAANFPSPFGVIARVPSLDGSGPPLDDQVDAQPLLVPGLTIAGGTHDVVYVATESNTVYAIDASTGAILLSRNLGPPVPVPLGCAFNGPNVGINSTPVIDIAAHILYVIAYTNGSSPVYQLHALDLSTLNDTVNPPNGVQVSASHTLTDGSAYTFNASVERQRPALLELNGVVYAAFGSFCDKKASMTRGWLLGWNAGTLAPLAANELTETRATDPGVKPPVFLDSIWMSGYGIAGNGTDLFFSTGNSDCNFRVKPAQCPKQTTNNGRTNIQESVVRLRLQGLAQPKIVGVFTPSDVLALDAADQDLGSGGVLLFPTGDTTYPHLAVTAGKDGRLFLLNPASMSTPLDTQISDACFCGPSFFVGSDGINRIVTSQGSTIRTYQVQLSPSPHLILEGSGPIDSGQNGGFFTVVSSNGTTAGSAIIWAVGRPTGADPTNPTAIKLFAFSAPPGSLTPLFSAVAGAWPNTGGNANIVPVVANGKVYVASAFKDASGNTRGQLNIFGPGGTGTPFASSVAPVAGPHAVSGTILAVSGSTLTLKTRTGKSATVDASQAIRNEQVGTPLSAGVPVTVQGSTVTGNGALVATSIDRAKGTSGELWPPDQ